MTQDIWEQTSESGCLQALLAALPDLVLVLVDNRVVYSHPGASDGLSPALIKGRSLPELLSADQLEQLNPLLESARAAPGTTHRLEYVWRPEHLPALRDAGLRKPIRYEACLVATATGEVVWWAREVNERAQSQRKVTGQVQRDPLTGIHNRRALMTVMEQTVAQAQRYDWTCSLLLIDVDDFSGINDQHGWDAGDRLLQQMVTGLQKLKRTADFLARYGDDQLVLFVPETNLDQAMLVAERVRRLVADTAVVCPSGTLHGTVSVGVAGLRGPEDNADEMLQRAHANLSIARNRGGNQVAGE